MQDIQEKVQKFCDEHNLNTSPQSRLIDTVSELGEVAKELLVGSDYGKKSFQHNEKIELEIGDVVFSIIALSNSLDINIEDALQKVLKKYDKDLEIKEFCNWYKKNNKNLSLINKQLIKKKINQLKFVNKKFNNGFLNTLSFFLNNNKVNIKNLTILFTPKIILKKLMWFY